MDKKATIKTFFQAVNSGDTAAVRNVVNEDYIQHNPFIPTGREPFLGLFSVLEQYNTQVENVRMFEDGNFVVNHNIWKNATPFGAEIMISFDVLRFDKNRKIAEHWDAMMPLTPPNPSGRTLTDGPTEVNDQAQTEANKVTVTEMFQVFINGSQEEVGAIVIKNFLPDYHQHTPTAGDGIEAVFEAFAREQWAYKVNHKVLGEGNFVLSISEGTAKGTPVAFYDLLRFENGKIAEHWDVIQAIPSKGLANENTMFNF